MWRLELHKTSLPLRRFPQTHARFCWCALMWWERQRSSPGLLSSGGWYPWRLYPHDLTTFPKGSPHNKWSSGRHICLHHSRIWTQVFKNQSHKVVCHITWDMVPTQARYFSLSEMAVSLTWIPLRNSPKQCLPFGENKYHLQYFWMKP